MAGHDQDQGLEDTDVYADPARALPTFRWRQALKGLATRRQLRAMGLRPGSQEPVARIECRRGARFAWLYRIDRAVPKIPMTLAKEAALTGRWNPGSAAASAAAATSTASRSKPSARVWSATTAPPPTPPATSRPPAATRWLPD
jgi:hypothetical protein